MNTDLKPNLYEVDYVMWLADTIDKIKHQNYEQIDWANLVDEIEDISKSERRRLESNLVVVLMHLLKWNYQPERRSTSWESSIEEHRRRIRKALKASPSLKSYLEEVFQECYEDAVKQASIETQIELKEFPENCPYSISETLESEV
jgi:hypothetical protein